MNKAILSLILALGPVAASPAATLSIDASELVDSRALITTAGDPNNGALYGTPLNAGYDGVGALIINSALGSSLCSGALLMGGGNVMTAAHCLTDGLGNDITTGIDAVFFPGDGGGAQEIISIASWVIHPLWNGIFLDGNDLAVLTLANLASPGVQRYQTYQATDEIGQGANLVGFGASGNGNQGDVLPAGTRRQAFNVFDAFFAPTILATDFDNGLSVNNVIGGLGLGLLEGNPAPGDSGGPAFINGQIAGVISFGATTGQPPDVDNQLNSSFGETAGYTRVSSFNDFIIAALIPEPSTYVLFGSALLLLVWRYRR